jgi:hypothetical protein
MGIIEELPFKAAVALKFENRTTKGKSKGIVKKMNNKDPS